MGTRTPAPAHRLQAHAVGQGWQGAVAYKKSRRHKKRAAKRRARSTKEQGKKSPPLHQPESVARPGSAWFNSARLGSARTDVGVGVNVVGVEVWNNRVITADTRHLASNVIGCSRSRSSSSEQGQLINSAPRMRACERVSAPSDI